MKPATRPDSTRKRAMRVLTIMIGLAPILAVFIYGAVMWRDILLLAYSGVMIDGHVVSRRETGQENRLVRYYLTYSFETGNPGETKTYIREREVPKGIYNTHLPASNVLVMFLPSNPRVSNIVRNDPAAIPSQRIMLVLAVFSIPVLVVFFLLMIYRARQDNIPEGLGSVAVEKHPLYQNQVDIHR